MEEIIKFIQKSQVAILYITTKDCNVCKVLKPKIKNICKKYSIARDKYIELNDIPEIGGQFGVFAIPTILLFIEGKESLRFSRNMDLLDFESKLARYCDLLENK